MDASLTTVLGCTKKKVLIICSIIAQENTQRSHGVGKVFTMDPDETCK